MRFERSRARPVPAPPPMAEMVADAAAVMKAVEEELGDLKLYRVPERVTVSAKGLKQIAFLQKDEVEGDIAYTAECRPGADDGGNFRPVGLLFRTRNDEVHGLGAALPMGGVTIFEPASAGELLLAETNMRDQAEGQEVEIALGESPQVQFSCAAEAGFDWRSDQRRWLPMRVAVTNANDRPVRVRLSLGAARDWTIRKLRGTFLKDGQRMVEFEIPPNDSYDLTWEAQSAYAEAEA